MMGSLPRPRLLGGTTTGSAHVPLPQTWGGLQGVLSRPGVHAWARRTAGGVVLVGDPGTPGLVAQCSPRPQGGSTARAAPSWAGARAGAGPSRGPLARDAPRYRPHPLGTLPAASTRGFSPESGGEVGKGQRLTGRQEPDSQGGGPFPTSPHPRSPSNAGAGWPAVSSAPSPVSLRPGILRRASGGLPHPVPLSVSNPPGLEQAGAPDHPSRFRPRRAEGALRPASASAARKRRRVCGGGWWRGLRIPGRDPRTEMTAGLYPGHPAPGEWVRRMGF